MCQPAPGNVKTFADVTSRLHSRVCTIINPGSLAHLTNSISVSKFLKSEMIFNASSPSPQHFID